MLSVYAAALYPETLLSRLLDTVWKDQSHDAQPSGRRLSRCSSVPSSGEEWPSWTSSVGEELGQAIAVVSFFGYPQSRNLTGENFRPGPSSMLLRPSESLVGFEANRSAGLRTPLSGRSSRTEEASTWSGVVPVESARRNGLRTWLYFRGDAAFGARPLTGLAFPPRSGFVSIFGG